MKVLYRDGAIEVCCRSPIPPQLLVISPLIFSLWDKFHQVRLQVFLVLSQCLVRYHRESPNHGPHTIISSYGEVGLQMTFLSFNTGLSGVLAGTAGCVLAARLSEDPNTTVLLIEAGQKYVYLSSTRVFSWL